MSSCLWDLAHDRHAEVVLAADGTAGLAGVIRCGLRSCPNCARILANEDFQRARRVAETWAEDGSMLIMVTFTMRHGAQEPLPVTKDALLLALQSMYRSRRYRSLLEQYGLTANRFYGNEVTDGVNGWHLHRHECWEAKPAVMPVGRRERRSLAAALQHELTDIWLHELTRRGRSALPGYAVVVTVTDRNEHGDRAASYVTKMAMEVTYSPAKGGRHGGKSPWELLDDAGDKSLSPAQRARARARYREFVDATKGMHWTWFSDGCAVGPNPDEVPWADDKGTPVLPISDFQWRCLRSQHRVTWLLELVEHEGAVVAGDELRRWCDTLRWSHRFRWREPWQDRPGGQLMDQAAF